jgi:hypothetical protein
MKRLFTLCVASILLAGCSSDNPKEPSAAAPGAAPTAAAAPVAANQNAQSSATVEPAKPKYFEERKQTVTANVTAINKQTREVTLKTDDGKEMSFVASPEVRNLEQVNVGDKVLVGYYESLGINVQKPGEAVNSAVLAADRAAAGEKPGGYIAQHTTLTSTVESMDKTVPSVTLKGPAGNLRTFRLKDASKLDNVNIGDHVIMTYTEALAVSVEEVK